MKKKKCLLGLFVPSLLLAVAGCAREEAGGKGETPANKISLTATFENVQDEGATKVDISTSGAFTWTEGDQIAVHTSTPNWQTATLESGADLASGVFTAQMDETDRDGYAIYPASVAGGTDAAPTITLPSEYTIDGSMGEYSPLPMIAVNAPNTGLAFKHVGGIFRITLNKVPEGTKSIVVTMDKQITGTFTVDLSDASKPTITTTGAASSNTVTFNFSTAFAAETDDVVLNVPVPVGLYTSLSVEAYNAVDGGGSHLSGASNDNDRDILHSHGKTVALEIAPNNERIGSFSISDKEVRIGKNDAAGGWITLTYSAYDMSPTPVAISDATITCIANSNANVEWQVSGGTEIQVRAAANAPAGEVATMTFRMGYCNDYKTATVTVTTSDNPVSGGNGFGTRSGKTVVAIAPANLKETSSGVFTFGDNYLDGLSIYKSSTANTTYPRAYFTSSESANSNMTVTKDGYTWKVPSQNQLTDMFTYNATYRTGATIKKDDGTANTFTDHDKAVYAKVCVTGIGTTLTNYTSTNSINGLLLFQDGAVVEFSKITQVNTADGSFINLTKEEVDVLIKGGCAFLPCAGSCMDSDSVATVWRNAGTHGYYRSTGSRRLFFHATSVIGGMNTGDYYSVRLVRDYSE